MDFLQEWKQLPFRHGQQFFKFPECFVSCPWYFPNFIIFCVSYLLTLWAWLNFDVDSLLVPYRAGFFFVPRLKTEVCSSLFHQSVWIMIFTVRGFVFSSQVEFSPRFLCCSWFVKFKLSWCWCVFWLRKVSSGILFCLMQLLFFVLTLTSFRLFSLLLTIIALLSTDLTALSKGLGFVW